MKFKESDLAHKYLDGLKGLEIGGSAHNSFGLNTKNVDYTDSMDTVFKQAEIKMCGEAMPVDIVAFGDNIPLPYESQDFVISSHVIEHFYDPIGTIKEWKRLIKKGGFIFIIAPKREFSPGDELRPISTMQELIARHLHREKKTGHEHFTVFDVKLLCDCLKFCILEIVETQIPDDKVGNGFTVIAKKI